MRRMIEEVSASDRLRKRVLAFYDDQRSIWKDDGMRKIIRISQDEETLALAQSLAFQLCGSGRLSELGRLLIRFYAAHGGEATLYSNLAKPGNPKLTLVKKIPHNVTPIRAEVTPADTQPKVPNTFTLDPEAVTLLGALSLHLQKKNSDLVSYLIEGFTADEQRLEELRRWLASADPQEAGQSKVTKRLQLTPQIDALLSYLSYMILGTVNKSATIRALIKCEAGRKGLHSGRRKMRH